jgi:uncharacterized protein involved in outer membrane biogenesis
MKTTTRIVLILILIAIIVGAIIAASSLDAIVKKGVETFGPQFTKTTVNLESVHIILFNGSAKIKGLVIGNPEGYKAPQAISASLIEAGVNPLSIWSDKIVVRTLHVIDPEISFEGGLSGNNLGKIMENVNDYSKTGAKASSNVSASPTQSNKKIEVDDFLITGAKVHVRLTDLGGKEMTINLPEVHLTNLGTGSDGLTPAELTRTMLQALSAATLKAVSSNATNLGKFGENLGKDAAKNAAEGADTIKKGIGGLFGK